MSHITIIISKSAPAIAEGDLGMEPSYEYQIPVPHGASPKKVGEMVRRAFQHLEGSLVDGSGQAVKEDE